MLDSSPANWPITHDNPTCGRSQETAFSTCIDEELPMPRPGEAATVFLRHRDAALGSSAACAWRRLNSQNVNVSSSAIKMTGGPPDEIFTALAKVSLPPADSAHF
jgi:hypothetical protein